MHNAQRRVGESFELARRKILLAQLDEINPATSGFRDFRQHGALARVLVTGKLGAIGDIEKNQAFTD